MGEWLKENALLLVTIFVAVIAIPIGVWAARKWGTRRAKLQIVMDSTGLLVPGELPDKLEVNYGGVSVIDPHLVTFWLKNIGPRDIKRDDFDEGKPLIFPLRSEFYGFVETDSNNGTTPSFGTAPGDDDGSDHDGLIIRPAHIPKGTQWVTKFIVSGPSSIVSQVHLIDTGIVYGETTGETFMGMLIAASRVSMPWPFNVLQDIVREVQKSRQ